MKNPNFNAYHIPAKTTFYTKYANHAHGSVYWMLSHPKEDAELICGGFTQTL
jgi:hypothetical protein